MIVAITVIALAFTWLIYETDYLRIRLPVGVDIQPIEYARKSWLELKPWNTKKNDPMWLTSPDYMEPLCGRDWLENTMHIIPEYKIELDFGGIKYKMNILEPKVLKDVIKVNTAKHNPIRKPAKKKGTLAPNPNYPRPSIKELVDDIPETELVGV